MSNRPSLLLTESSQSLSELVLINKARVVPVVGPEDVLPVCDVFPHPGKLVKVHSTFIFSVEHGWKRGKGIIFTTYLVEAHPVKLVSSRKQEVLWTLLRGCADLEPDKTQFHNFSTWLDTGRRQWSSLSRTCLCVVLFYHPFHRPGLESSGRDQSPQDMSHFLWHQNSLISYKVLVSSNISVGNKSMFPSAKGGGFAPPV